MFSHPCAQRDVSPSPCYANNSNNSNKKRIDHTPRQPYKSLCSGDLEPIARHTRLVLLHQILTFGLWIIGFGEQHALVAGGFLVLAYAAWLNKYTSLAWFLECAEDGQGSGKPSALKIGCCRIWTVVKAVRRPCLLIWMSSSFLEDVVWDFEIDMKMWTRK